MLYKRDYLLGFADEEKKEFKEVTGRDFSVKRIGGFGTANNFMSFSKAARMCKMLFPNMIEEMCDRGAVAEAVFLKINGLFMISG